MLEFIFDATRAVSYLIFTVVLERHPSIRFVVTHGGGALPLMGERIESFAGSPETGARRPQSSCDASGMTWRATRFHTGSPHW